MENHKECFNFDNDCKFKSENLMNQQLPIPPRVNNYNLPRNPAQNFNPMYPNNYSNYYGMGNFSSNIYHQGFGNVPNAKLDNRIMESFSSLNSAVQTFNAFNTLINTAYGAMFTSISTISGVAEQMNRTKSHFLEIISSVNFLKIIKRFLLFLKRIFSGDLPKMEDIASTITDIKNSFKWNSPNSANILSYLFFVTIICGPIVIYKFLKSVMSTRTDASWNSEIGKSYAAKVKNDFVSRNPDELSVLQGEIVTIAPPDFQKEVNWYLVGNLKGEQGLIPSSFVSVLGILNKNKNQEESP